MAYGGVGALRGSARDLRHRRRSGLHGWAEATVTVERLASAMRTEGGLRVSPRLERSHTTGKLRVSPKSKVHSIGSWTLEMKPLSNILYVDHEIDVGTGKEGP
jgi:hypothetical protein